MKTLVEEDIEFQIVIKEKDSVKQLLDQINLPFLSLGAYKSNADKLRKLPKFVRQIRQLVDKHDIRKIVGVHPIHGSIASKFSKVETIGFADTDHAFEQMALYWPFCNSIYTPIAFRHRFGTNQLNYRGFHELAYIHPKYFQPSKEGLEDQLENGPPILYRMISWDATHDIGINKAREREIKFVKNMATHHPVIVSCEGDIPKELTHLEQSFPVSKLHDMLSFSKLYIGAGATTAIEASLLGTPSIYTNSLMAGVLDFLDNNYRFFGHYPNYLRYTDDPGIIEEMIDGKKKGISRDQLLGLTIDVKKLVDAVLLNDTEMISKLTNRADT